MVIVNLIKGIKGCDTLKTVTFPLATFFFFFYNYSVIKRFFHNEISSQNEYLGTGLAF